MSINDIYNITNIIYNIEPVKNIQNILKISHYFFFYPFFTRFLKSCTCFSVVKKIKTGNLIFNIIKRCSGKK